MAINRLIEFNVMTQALLWCCYFILKWHVAFDATYEFYVYSQPLFYFYAAGLVATAWLVLSGFRVVFRSGLGRRADRAAKSRGY